MTAETPPTPPPEPAPKKRSRRTVIIAAVVALVVVLGGGWVAAYALAGEDLPNGTEIAGVDVGSMTREEAAAELEQQLQERRDAAITVKVGDVERRIGPQKVGLDFDVEATLDAAGAGRSWNPVSLWRHYTGGRDLDPVLSVDRDRVAKIATQLTRKAGRKPKNARVGFDGATVTTSDPKPGEGLAADDLEQALLDTYLAEDRTVDLELSEQPAAIGSGELKRAVDEDAEPAVSGPATLTFEGTSVKLSPAEIGSALRMVPEDGSLVLKAKPKALRKAVSSGVSGVTREPRDATVRLKNGSPTVVPSKKGVKVATEELTGAFLDAVAAEGKQRTVSVESTVAKPDFTTQDAKDLQITERVSTFSTEYPNAEYRNVNLTRAAELIDGTVLEPGETFSMNETVGERTAENGFTSGWIIADGVFRSELGGGVSQMATTLYNAGFFAGLKDVEHKAHSLYISRYPVGREATLAWPTVDLKFKNDTPYGVLISADVTPGTETSDGYGVVTVSMYSTKTWDITTKTGDRYAITSPGHRTVTDGNCEDTAGQSGFTIDVWRYFRKPGESELQKTEKITTVYQPTDTVECWEGGVNPNPPTDDGGGDNGNGGGNSGGGGNGGGGNGGGGNRDGQG